MRQLDDANARCPLASAALQIFTQCLDFRDQILQFFDHFRGASVVLDRLPNSFKAWIA